MMPGFFKNFFFLTDVAVEPALINLWRALNRIRSLKPVARSAFYEEEQLYNQYGRDKEVIVRGPAGTILAEDTSGFHRGSKIERGYRLVMQFEFSAQGCTYGSGTVPQTLLRFPLPICTRVSHRLRGNFSFVPKADEKICLH